MKMMNSFITNVDDSVHRNSDPNKQLEVVFIPQIEYAYLDIYPNPSNGNFTLCFRTNKVTYSKMQVNVYDITGSCVYKTVLSGQLTSIDLSFLSKGVYYLHASNSEDSFNQKLIIN